MATGGKRGDGERRAAELIRYRPTNTETRILLQSFSRNHHICEQILVLVLFFVLALVSLLVLPLVRFLIAALFLVPVFVCVLVLVLP